MINGRRMSLVLYDLSHSPYCLPIKRILGALKVVFEVEEDEVKAIHVVGADDEPFGSSGQRRGQSGTYSLFRNA